MPATEIAVVPNAERLTTPATVPLANAELPAGPIAEDMIQYPRLAYYEQNVLTGSVGGLDMTVHIQRHLLETPDWQYRGDGRIYSLPVVTEDAVYVASTAGDLLRESIWYHPLALLAAPAHDELIANGQLENRWPVLNVVSKDDTIYAVAGRHVELNGGGYFWALNAADGAIKQHFRMHTNDRPGTRQPRSCQRPAGQPTLGQ